MVFYLLFTAYICKPLKKAFAFLSEVLKFFILMLNLNEALKLKQISILQLEQVPATSLKWCVILNTFTIYDSIKIKYQ